MDVPAHTETAHRHLAGVVTIIVALVALFAAGPAMAEEAVVDVPVAPVEAPPTEEAPTAEETVPATPAEEPGAVPVAEDEAVPLEDLLTALPAEEAAVEPDPAPVAREAIPVEPAAPSLAAPAAPLTAVAAPPNAAPDAPSVATAPSRPDPVTPVGRPYATPIGSPAQIAPPEPPPDPVPAALTKSRLKLSDSGLGSTIDKLTKEWGEASTASAGTNGEIPLVEASTPFVEQITEVRAYSLPSAGGGFLQLLVAWVAPGDLGGAAVLAPITQLLFVLVAWMLVRPRPLRESLSRFSADPRVGYRAVVLRPG